MKRVKKCRYCKTPNVPTVHLRWCAKNPSAQQNKSVAATVVKEHWTANRDSRSEKISKALKRKHRDVDYHSAVCNSLFNGRIARWENDNGRHGQKMKMIASIPGWKQNISNKLVEKWREFEYSFMGYLRHSHGKGSREKFRAMYQLKDLLTEGTQRNKTLTVLERAFDVDLYLPRHNAAIVFVEQDNHSIDYLVKFCKLKNIKLITINWREFGNHKLKSYVEDALSDNSSMLFTI